MKKVRRLTNRIAAMVLSGMLVVGSVPGVVLASENQTDLGQTSEIAAEVPEGADTEEVSAEVYSESPAAQEEEEAAGYYTVTLDANGGYFENEWDDADGEIVEQAEKVTRQIPVGGPVAGVPVFADQDGQTMLFAGWSLEPDGELVSPVEEEYVPVENCVLYAVWQAPEDASWVDTNAEGAGAADTAQETDAAEESGDTGAEDESESAQESGDAELIEETGTGSEDTEQAEEEPAQEYEDTETTGEADTAQETTEEEYTASEEKSAEEVEAEPEQDLTESVEEAEKAETTENEEPVVTEEEVKESEAKEAALAEGDDVVASGKCGKNVTWTLTGIDENLTLTISGSGEMDDYQENNYTPSWRSKGEKIKTVVVEDGITTIGNYSFYSLNGMTSITIPDSVTSIGYGAFHSCTSLTSVTIPDSVTSIGSSAFRSCTSLTSILIPDGVTSLESCAFQSCTSLTSITIPNSVTSIGGGAFDDCAGLTSITIPDGVTRIRSGTFSGCSNLETITIPNGVTSIEEDAFYGCSNLETITIPDGVTSIERYTFYGCSNLETITIPNGVTSIGSYAFNGCSSLTNITIPDGVTSIKEYTFNDCSNLETITIPDSVTSIESCAFQSCSSLTNITIPDGVTSIGGHAFTNCSSLPSIRIPNGVTTIEDSLFLGCSSLVNITMPDSATSIGGLAFANCSSLTSITIPNGVTYFDWSMLHNCVSLTKIRLPESISKITNNMGIDCHYPLKAIIYTSSEYVINLGKKCCPYIEQLSPEPYTEDVAINSADQVFYADFMCDIAYNDGFAYLFETGIDNTPVDEIFLGEPDEGKCSIENGNRLILHFSLDKLKKGKSYYIRIEENAIKLLDQNKSFPGLAKDIWTFSIGDLFAVKELYPEPGAENVDYNSDSPLFYINFAEKIDSNNGYAYLYEVGNNTPIETIYIGEDDDVRYGIFNEHRLVLNFSPASKRTLQQGKSYYITIDEGAIKFIDDEYNELDMHFPGIDKNVWTFSTINLDYFCFINPTSEIVDERFYKELFGPIRWEDVKENGNNGSKGLCFGLNYVVGLNMIQADSIKSCLNSAEKKLSDFKTIKDLDGCKASDSQYSLLDYVKKAFIYQYTSSKNNEGSHNENHYTSLYNAIDKNLSSKPICIGIITDGEDEAVGHSLFPIEILKETDEYCDVLVYDSNGTEVSWKDCFGKTQRMHTFLHTLRLWKSKGDFTGAEYDGSACTKINYVSVDSRFNLDVTKDIYNIVSSTFCLIDLDLQPLFGTSGSEPVSSVNRYLYWTEAKILELNLTDTNTVSLAGVDDEIEITANAGATVRLDIENNTAKIDNIDASSEDYTITHTHAEDYDNIKSVVISGETSSTVNTESTDSGIIVSNEDNTPIEAVISVIDNDEEVTTVDITAITNTVNVICDENNQIEVLEDTDSDGTYETVVATTDCKSIRNAEITGIVDKQYTGSAILQNISVTYDGTELNESTDYTIAYRNNINAGTASVIITGIGDYTGTITKTFTIEKAAQSITADDLSLALPGTGIIFVSGNQGNLTFVSDNTDVAEVDASGNVTAKGVGTANITITAEATDNYMEATKTITVTVAGSAYYAVTMDANGGVIINETDDDTGREVTNAETVTKYIAEDRYAFIPSRHVQNEDESLFLTGWALSPDGDPVTGFNESFKPDSDCTLYAVWKHGKPAGTMRYGDLNYNGILDGGDGIKIQRHNKAYNDTSVRAKHPDWIMAGYEYEAADINHDAVINGADYMLLIRDIAARNNEETQARHPDWIISETFTTYSFDGIEPRLVTGITLNNSEIVLEKGKSATLTADLVPKDADDTSIAWSSSNAEVATVDVNGSVKGVSEGTATITAAACDGSGVYAACEVTVTAPIKSIEEASVTGITSRAYTGNAITQELVVKIGDTILEKDIDYTIAYSNNINVGTATVTITGKGNYKGTASADFKINKAAQSITAKAVTSPIAVGKATIVSVTGAEGTKSFKSSDTTIATVDSKTGKVTARKVGTVKITATSAATENYNAASKTVTIKVVPAATTSLTAANQVTGIKLTWKKVAGANGYLIYRGSTLIKTITNGNTVSFVDKKANTNGTRYVYKVVAKAATGTSRLSKSVAFFRVARPVISSLRNVSSKKIKVKWGKNAKATGYKILYSRSKTFVRGNKSVTFAGAANVSKVIGKLTKRKTYYVSVRAYKIVGGKVYWSEWSAVKGVKISK